MVAAADFSSRVLSCARRIGVLPSEVDKFNRDFTRRLEAKRKRARLKNGDIDDDILQQEALDDAVDFVKSRGATMTSTDEKLYTLHNEAGMTGTAEGMAEVYRRALGLRERFFNQASTENTPVEQAVGMNKSELVMFPDRHEKALRDKATALQIITHFLGRAPDWKLPESAREAADAIWQMNDIKDNQTIESFGDGFITAPDFVLPQRLNADFVGDDKDAFIQYMLTKTDNTADELGVIFDSTKNRIADDLGEDALDDILQTGLKFIGADEYLQVMEKYTGVDNLYGLITRDIHYTGKRNALVGMFGHDLARAEREILQRMGEMGVSDADIALFKYGFRNARGMYEVPVPLSKNTLKKRAQETALISRNIAGIIAVEKLKWSALKAFLSAPVRVWRDLSGGVGATRGAFYAIRGSLAALPSVKERTQAWNLLRGARMESHIMMTRVYEQAKVLGESGESLYSRGKAEVAADGAKRIVRRGVLGWSGFDQATEFGRNAAVFGDMFATSDILKKNVSWAKLDAGDRGFFTELGIGEAQYNAALETYHGGGVIDYGGSKLLDIRAMANRNAGRAFSARWNARAADQAGYVSLGTDAAMKGISKPRTGTRVIMDSITALFRDPWHSTGKLIEAVGRPVAYRGLAGLPTSGAILTGYAASGVAVWYAYSQIKHIITHGEPHNHYEKDPEAFVGRALMLNSLELLGGYVYDVPYISDDDAIVSGGPMIDLTRSAGRSLYKKIIEGDDEEAMKILFGTSDEEKALKNFLREAVPLPGFITDPVLKRKD